MDDTDRQTFGSLLYQLAEVYQRQLSDVQIQGYWMALRDLPLSDVRGGMLAAFRQEEFFPTPAAIRRLAFSGSADRPTPLHPATVPEHQQALSGEVDSTTDKDQAKVNLAKIQAMLDEIGDKVSLAKPDTSAEVAHYAAIGREVMDPTTLNRAYRDALKPKTKRGRR